MLASQGADIPILGMNPTFNPSLLRHAGRRRPAGQRATASPASRPTPPTHPGVQAANELYTAADPDGAIGWEVPLAYAQAELLRTALEGACEAGDLTPEGVVAAMREGDSTSDTDGLLPDGLDFSHGGRVRRPGRCTCPRSATRAEAGLELLDTYEGPSAQSYTFG